MIRRLQPGWQVIAVLLTILGLGFCAEVSGGEIPDRLKFSTDVAPILCRRCLGCHDNTKPLSGLNLSTYTKMRAGGKSSGQDIIVPGDPQASYLLTTLAEDFEPRMPYKSPPLTRGEIDVLRSWIQQGAKFDGPSETDSRIDSLFDPLANLPTVGMRASQLAPCTSIVVSPRGEFIAAAAGKEILLFDRKGHLRKTLTGHDGPLNSLVFTPDGAKLIAAGGRPGMFGEVAVWDMATQRKVLGWKGHSDSILSAAISPDGRSLATGGYDRLVTIWDLPSGKSLHELKEHTDAVHAVCYSPEGTSLASASADRTVKIWDTVSGKKRLGFSDAMAELYSAAYSPDGSTLYAAGVDRSIHAWSMTERRIVKSVFAHDAPVLRLVISPDGKGLTSIGEDRRIKVFSLPSLDLQTTLPVQTDWPLALALLEDTSEVVVGRYEGSIAVLSATDGSLKLDYRTSDGTVKRPEPSLTREVSLNALSPRFCQRGTTVRMTLRGTGAGNASELISSDPGISAALTPRKPFDENAIDAELRIGKETRPGIHRISFVSPMGVPVAQPIAIVDEPASLEHEPNDQSQQAITTPLPIILVGAIDAPGDRDLWQFEAKAGDEVVATTACGPLQSALNPVMTVRDLGGHVVARSRSLEGRARIHLEFRPERSGTFLLSVEDQNLGGSANHAYWVRLGNLPMIDEIAPLGLKSGERTSLTVRGSNIQGWNATGLTVTTDRDHEIVPVPIPESWNLLGEASPRVVAVNGSLNAERATNGTSSNSDSGWEGAQRVDVPGCVSGVISASGEQDLYAFQAKKGQPLILETYARRLDSPLDSSIEILDERDRPVPRALLEPVAETHVAFRDHASKSRTLRLTEWSRFRERDLVLMGRELSRLEEMPRNPDDDALMWGTGVPRAGGERIGLLDTTPEHHHLGQSLFKVNVHPPGTILPRREIAPVVLTYFNDDGGPSYLKDSRLTFDPPNDGRYFIRVKDTLDSGGPSHSYLLMVREPRPDFRLELDRENVNIPEGSTALIQVHAIRLDGFNEPIDLTIEGLPEGIQGTTSRIERDRFTATLGFSASQDSPTGMTRRGWKVVGRSGEFSRQVEFGAPLSGHVSITSPPNLTVNSLAKEVSIRPGERVELRLVVERSPAFKGRVPIEVRNLPQGVRVLDLGLNGILVPEAETERTITLFAEEWVDPIERTFFAVGKCEPAGTEHASTGVLLRVGPRAVAGPATIETQ